MQIETWGYGLASFGQGSQYFVSDQIFLVWPRPLFAHLWSRDDFENEIFWILILKFFDQIYFWKSKSVSGAVQNHTISKYRGFQRDQKEVITRRRIQL